MLIPNRDQALELFKRYNKTDRLLKHAFAVEGVMRYMAKTRGGDEELWGIVGLMHDLDFEMYPDEHCVKVQEILKEERWPDEIIRAIASHGWGLCCDIEPESDMEKVLFAVDELTGLISATALMRPSKSILDTETKSVKKKWKNKQFAAGVDRSVIEKGAEMLGMEISELITETIKGMRGVASEIGLQGSNSTFNH